MKRIATVVIDIELAVALVLVVALVGVGFLGFRPFVVLSASMEPAVHVGALAYVDTRIDPAGLKAGDIVSFSADSSTTVTHRVVSVDPREKQIVTKGDANAQPDASPVSFGSVVGKLVFSIPAAGALLHAFVQNKAAWIVVLVLLNAALLVLPGLFGGEGRVHGSGRV